jgi:hypothetical protein
MIEDSSELTQFQTFVTTGVKTTDTFNAWRKKTNGIVQLFSLLQENSADVESPVTFDYTNATIRIKTDGIKTINIENSAVTGDKIANLTITEGKLAANSVTEAKIGAASVTESKIGTGAVTEAKIGTAAVTTFKIGNLAVTDTKLATNAVTESKIANGSVTVDKIGTSAVTNEKIADLAVTETKIGIGAVTTAKIAALAVTEARIGNGAITEIKLGTSAVTELKIANSAVTTDKIANDSITANKLNGGQSGAAPIFAARAYVFFKANADDNQNGNFTRTPSNGTIVDGVPGHNLQVGHAIFLERVSGGSFNNGKYVVTEVLSASSFRVNHNGSASTGVVSAKFWRLIKTGNVSSVTRSANNAAQFVINFTTPMPTNNFVINGNCNWADYVYDDESSGEGRANTTQFAHVRSYYNNPQKVLITVY